MDIKLKQIIYATVIASFVFSITGCKTQSQIRREQKIENLTRQLSESQQMSADRTIRLQEMEERVNHLQGAIEEKGYAEQIEREESMTKLENRLDSLENAHKEVLEKLEETQKQIEAQRSYLDQVLETLQELSDGSSLKKKSTEELYNQAVSFYRSADYGGSRAYFLELLERDIEGQTLAHTYHNLGMVEYIAGRDDDALVYFSRLFTEFPESGYNRNGLLFLAKTFERKGQKNEARQALEQLIERFPDANRIDDAKAMLERLRS